MVKELHVSASQPPRQGTHEREHDPHRPEGAATSVRYNVAQTLRARKTGKEEHGMDGKMRATR